MKILFKGLLILFVLLTSGNSIAANRLVYNNFNDKSMGSLSPIKTGLTRAVPGEYNLDQVGRGGSGYCFSSGTFNATQIMWIDNVPKPWPSEEFYTSFWMRYPNFTSTDPMENFKIFYPHWNGTNSYVHFSAASNNGVYYSAKMNGQMVSQSNWLTYPNMMDGNWHHYEFYVNFATGASRAWYDGNLTLDHSYGPGWSQGEMYYVTAPSIDAEEAGVFSRQVDDWEVWDGMPSGTSGGGTSGGGTSTALSSPKNLRLY